MKRKHEGSAAANGSGKAKKRAISDDEAKAKFRKGLFDPKVLAQYTSQYAASEPYKHAVIQSLIDDSLLRSVRQEILDNISFTPKETDIYKIHQSGDLANLDGLDDSSLSKLPSLITLRDALYSSAFRKYVAAVSNSGPLSGVKTDMAVNVYTPGCHLLCHDDVIGSRRVSYILYLLDPDRPWKPEWGGALRLYPTETFKNDQGVEVKVPQADFSVSIPPAFNQLAFFVVTPGESFHDVEEVYHRAEGDSEDDGGRIRMAISGWFHIPQEGEEGYEEGLEEKLAERSSLTQLQSRTDKFDLPQPKWIEYDEVKEDEELELSAEDLQFLIRFMNPQYLTPDTVEQLAAQFEEESCLRLSGLLSGAFSARLRSFLEEADQKTSTMPLPPSAPSDYPTVARPPHKHRFLYRQPQEAKEKAAAGNRTPYDELVDDFFPSQAFKTWLSLATGMPLTKANILARRFRRAMDYTLATSYEDEEPQLEVCLGITPTPGWGEEDEDDDDDDDDENSDDEDGEDEAEEKPKSSKAKATNGSSTNGKGKGKAVEEAPAPAAPADEPVGGYEMYMAGDDDDEDDSASKDGVDIPAGSTHTGAGKRRKADPAIYRSGGDDEDDGVLFSMAAGWNNMSIVLRDSGTLKFVKYVSRKAKGDRWDVCGDFSVAASNEDDDE